MYVYACHWYLLKQFLDPANVRDDEYGGSLENRARLLRELIEETKEAVGDSCAVAVRFSASAGGDDDAQDTVEPRAVLEMLAELPDLWDITVHDYSYEMGTSRFVKEAGLEATMSWVKEVTGKPVVSVGRFTSPETMLRLVRQGIVDLVGAARPSIADPYLPSKIAEGREDDIRECIGCNICYSGDQTGTPIRCTQNPTMGEEWRKGWHPERIPPKGSDSSVLIVGGGPAGLEAAVALGQRGYDVTLTDARTELGGRVTLESSLPGMAEYARVRDWRLTQIAKLPNVEFHLDSVVDEAQIVDFGADRVVIATGARWRRDGTGRWLDDPVEGWDRPSVITPDDVMAGTIPSGPVVVFDDDHYYMGWRHCRETTSRGPGGDARHPGQRGLHLDDTYRGAAPDPGPDPGAGHRGRDRHLTGERGRRIRVAGVHLHRADTCRHCGLRRDDDLPHTTGCALPLAEGSTRHPARR